MEENKKNKRKSIAEWIAVFLCIGSRTRAMYYPYVCHKGIV